MSGMSENIQFLREECTVEKASSQNGNLEREESEGSSSVTVMVKVHPESYINNINSSTAQSWRRKSNRNINEQENVGFEEMDIERGSHQYVAKDKCSSSGGTTEEAETDVNANEASLVINFSNSDDSNGKRSQKKKKSLRKSKTHEVLDAVKSKKRSKTEETPIVSKKQKMSDVFDNCETEFRFSSKSILQFKCSLKSKNRKDTSRENSDTDTDLEGAYLEKENTKILTKDKSIVISDNEEESKNPGQDDTDIIFSNNRQRKRKSDYFKADNLEISKRRDQEGVLKLPDLKRKAVSELPDLSRKKVVSKTAGLGKGNVVSKPPELNKKKSVSNPSDLSKGKLPSKPSDFSKGKLPSKPSDFSKGKLPSKPSDFCKGKSVSKPSDLSKGKLICKPSDLSKGKLVSKPPELCKKKLVSKLPDLCKQKIVYKSPELSKRRVISKPPDLSKRKEVSKASESNKKKVVSKQSHSNKKKEVDSNNKTVHFQIVFKHEVNEKIFLMKKKKNSRLLKTKTKEYCADALGKPVESLRFLFKEKKVKDLDTPGSLGMVDGDIIEIEQKLPCIIEIYPELHSRSTPNTSGDRGYSGEQLRLNKNGNISMAGSLQKGVGESDKDMASHKTNVIEISSDDETETEYIEQDVSDVKEETKNNLHEYSRKEQSYSELLFDINYNYVCIEMETMRASNSRCKEITQIGGFKENTIGNGDARFFNPIEPKNLNHYLENYKLGGDLLQTLHMQKNECGKFEFRKQFEIMDEGRVATQCVSENEALEELSSYLASVENCIIVSLNDESIQLLINKMKLLGSTNKRIHMDSVKHFCTWSNFLRESGASTEDTNQEFEDWYDSHVKSSSSSESLKKHADVVAKMVHDSITALRTLVRPHQDVSMQLVKASRPINSLLSIQTLEQEPADVEIQYLEFFSSLRPDFPVTISLRKLETYDISSEDEGDMLPKTRIESVKVANNVISLPNESNIVSDPMLVDSELVRLAKSGTLTQLQAELAKLPVNDKTTRAAKLNHARRWTGMKEKFGDHSKSWDWFGDTAVIAAVRKGNPKMVAALLVAGADPTLAARSSDHVTEDAVTAARTQMKRAEVAMAVKEARNDQVGMKYAKLKRAKLRLERAKSTLELLLIASKYWIRAFYAEAHYSEERRKAFITNSNIPTDELKLKQEIDAFFNPAASSCPYCKNTFTTTLGRNEHIKAKHKAYCPMIPSYYPLVQIVTNAQDSTHTTVSNDPTKDTTLGTVKIQDQNNSGLQPYPPTLPCDLARLAKNGTLAELQAELAKLLAMDKATRAAKLNHARRWTRMNERFGGYGKSWDSFGDTPIIAAARKGRVKMVGALLAAGADPTLTARTSDSITEDAVTVAQTEKKKVEATVKEAEKDKLAGDSSKMNHALLRLGRASSTLELLLIANKYWTRAPYADVHYSEERGKAFISNPNMPTDEVKLKQEIDAFMKVDETKFNQFKQRIRDEDRKKILQSGFCSCPYCNEYFHTTSSRKKHMKVKHKSCNPIILPTIEAVTSTTNVEEDSTYTTVENAPTRDTTLETVPTVENAPTKDTTLETVPTRDLNNSVVQPYPSTLPSTPSQDYVVRNFNPYTTRHNHHWNGLPYGYGSFGGGFGRFRNPHPGFVNGGFGRFRHPHPGFGRFRHPHPGFGRFQHPPPQ